MHASRNSLANASSSYLRSAAHQPIQWHEWGEAAFAKARAEDKPILLDVGAVWCHWCHVMDRESYESPETAALINEHFVAIKVDRDERPDVDSRYQAAVQAISGQGGWPLTAFLTPEGKPFFGGTYFPPDDHFGRPGFKRVLLAIAQAYREKNSEVVESAESVMAAIQHAESFAGRGGRASAQIAQSMVDAAQKMFDASNGGFGSAPKFPHPSALDLCLEHFSRTGDDSLRTVIVTTLERMAKGGVYDQLAGGFHRYSVDEHWIVPHFEKMSYDNSELLKNYVHAYQALGDPFFATVARDIIRWMNEWLSDPEHGGFYASQDADYSLDDDGDYFTWTLAEASDILTADEFRVAALHYDIGDVGEMHHDPAKNVLFVRAAVSEIGGRVGLEPARGPEQLDSARQKMLAARLQRPTPYVDKTVYVSWNALCISAYLEAARVLGLPDARHFALRSLDRILADGWDPQRGLRHVIAYSEASEQQPSAPDDGHSSNDVVPSEARGGESKYASASPNASRGLLDDYCFSLAACLDAYESSADLTYFHFAVKIADMLLARFYDEDEGGFFDTPQVSFAPDREAAAVLGALIARRKPFQDSPTPAGNPAAAGALLRLFHYSNDARYRDAAQHTLDAFAGVAEQFGIFGATYGLAVLRNSLPPVQVVCVGEGAGADALYRAAVTPFAVNKSALRLTSNEAVAQNLPPVLAETIPNLPSIREDKPVAVLCSGFSCQPPIYDAEELSRALKAALAS